MGVSLLVDWGSIAWSPVGLQQAQCGAGVCYEPVNNSGLDGSLKELIYPGLFSNVGCKAQLWPSGSASAASLPQDIALQAHSQQQGLWAEEVTARMGWGPHRVSAGILFFVPPSPGWDLQLPLPS